MKKKSYLHTEQFTTQFTPESSYILGLLFADGHLNKKTNEIRISCIKEDVDIFESTFQCTGKWNRYDSFIKQKTRNNKPQGTLTCSDKTIKNILLSNKTFMLKEIPTELKHYWYRGYVDGDGCWTINRTSRILPSGTKNTFYNRKFTITSSEKQEWDFFEKLLKSLNINYKINRYNKNNKYSHLTTTGKNNFLILGNYLYADFPNDKIGLQRKYNKWKEIIQSYKT